ncbi:MAG: hypothetical protein EOO01_07375, partial [Chitinophagaceae bacterium]
GVKNNLFKECQGGVVLRHGDNNTVENNIFLGNYKEGTGGVRVINKGQWVVNNFFYACRGIDFRSPLSVMNGIPNSPAHRYVQVTDAVIANNTFYDCAAASFCEGSDAERTLPPANVFMANNIFFNSKDSVIYKTADDISGFSFIRNSVSNDVPQQLASGFIKQSLPVKKTGIAPLPGQLYSKTQTIPDSLQKVAMQRLNHRLSYAAGFGDLSLMKTVHTNATKNTGAKWWKPEPIPRDHKLAAASCATAAEVYKELEHGNPVLIILTAKEYTLNKPFTISSRVLITSHNETVRFNTGKIPAVFMINGGGALTIENLSADGAGVKANSFVCSDTSGPANHFNFVVSGSAIRNFDKTNGCENIFRGHKSTVADSIVLRNNIFSSNNTNTIMMADEKDDKGYYNAEKIFITHNNFNNQTGVLLNVYRGGNDESTMGPQLLFSHNKISDCRTVDNSSLLLLTGVQQTAIFSNNFSQSNAGSALITYKDIVRARHLLEKNTMDGSGRVVENGFVVKRENVVDGK